MIVNEVILGFLKEGKLFDASLGMRVPEIIQRLGEPEDISEETEPYLIYKYGALQVSFFEEKLVGIALYFEKNHAVFPTSKGQVDVDVCDLKKERLLSLASDQGIALSLDEQLTFDNQICLASELGARVFYGVDIGEMLNIQLLKVSLAEK